jgi:hypothetical protein
MARRRTSGTSSSTRTGHGTHTESVGHISPEIHPVGPLLKRYFFTAQLVSVRPEQRRASDGKMDQMITLTQLRELVLTTTIGGIDHPHPAERCRQRRARDWSGTNPCYLEAAAADLAAHHRRAAPSARPPKR